MEIPADASPDDIWILVAGPSGVGKSYLINRLSRGKISQVQSLRQNATTVLEITRLKYERICLVELLSSVIFEGPHLAASRAFAESLDHLYSLGITFSAVLWLHRIADVRLRGSTRVNLSLLYSIVGKHALSAVQIVTTFWDRQSEVIGERRQRELAESYFKLILDAGGAIHKFYPSTEDGANDILRRVLIGAKPVTLQIQLELSVNHIPFEETSFHLENSYVASPRTSLSYANRHQWPVVEVPSHSGSHLGTLGSPGNKAYGGIGNELYSSSPLVTSSQDIIIAVMGVTGAGKSSFIQYLTDQIVPVSSGLESFTENITIYRCSLPGTPKFFLIDTPGFDDTNRSDFDVLDQLADFLVTIWDSNIKLTGIIYLESIMEVGSGRAPDRHVAMFRQLCGDHAFSNVALVTSFWDVESEDGGRNDELKFDTEDQLRNDPKHWAGMIQKGSRMFRHRNRKETAVRIVRYLILKQNKVVLALQTEIGVDGKELPETAAGTVVAEQVAMLKSAHQRQISDIHKDIQKALEARDRTWQQRLEELQQQHQAEILRQTQTNFTYGASNISGQATAVLGSMYKQEHKTYQIQNATFVFENRGRHRNLKRSRQDYSNASDDSEEIKSVLREFLGRDSGSAPTTIMGPLYQTDRPLIPYDSYDYDRRTRFQ